jgi:hypothetical protein
VRARFSSSFASSTENSGIARTSSGVSMYRILVGFFQDGCPGFWSRPSWAARRTCIHSCTVRSLAPSIRGWHSNPLSLRPQSVACLLGAARTRSSHDRPQSLPPVNARETP